MYLELFSLNQYSLPPLRKEKLHTVSKILAHHFSMSQPGMIIRVEHRAEVLTEETYGLASVELDVQLQPSHIFQANMIKPLLSTLLILKFEEHGFLNLDDSVKKFFPDWAHDEVTIEHLLRHTSGLPDISHKKDYIALKRARGYKLDKLDILKGQLLNFKPGSQWELSESNNHITELLIEAITGESYYSAVYNHILKPLNMMETRTLRADLAFPHKVSGYRFNGNHILTCNVSSESSLFTSMKDLSKLFAAMKEGSLLLEPSWKKLMTTFQTQRRANSKFGMNCFIHTDRLYKTLQINNKSNGFEFHICYVPQYQLTTYILANCDSNVMTPAHVANLICDQLFTEDPVEEIETSVLEGYTGEYHFVSSGKIEVYVDETELRVKAADGESFRLRPIAPDVFVMAGSDLRFWFKRTKEGDVTAMEIRHRQLVPQEPPASRVSS